MAQYTWFFDLGLVLAQAMGYKVLRLRLDLNLTNCKSFTCRLILMCLIAVSFENEADIVEGGCDQKTT